MPIGERDPTQRLRQPLGAPAPAPPPPPAVPGAPLKKATAGTPMGGPTQQQLARRARNNGAPAPAPSVPARPGSPVPGPSTPVAAPVPGAPKPRAGTKGPNTATDPLPPEFAKLVKQGKYNEAQARKHWARSLGLLKGPAAGAPTPAPGPPVTTPPPGVPSPVPAGPAPGTPVGAAPGGGPIAPFGGGGSTAGGPVGGPMAGPYAGPGSPLVQPGTSGGMTDFRDPMMTFLSAVPMMNLNTAKQIDSAMAGFGDGGNRWSSTALGKAGELGAQNAMQQNALLTGLLREYSEGQENRALQATGQGMQFGGLMDEMAQNRVRLPAEVGQWEQGRQDQFQKDRYKDFEANKLGWFPYALNFASGQGAGSPGQIYTTQTPGDPGAAPWLELLAGLLK